MDDAFGASEGLGHPADQPERHCPLKPLEVTQTVADGFPFRVAATVGTRLTIHFVTITFDYSRDAK